MGNERNTEMDSGILYFTTILDDMWRGFKKFFLLCFLIMAICGAALYMREKTDYTPIYQAYSSFVVETKTAYGYNQTYSDETTAGQLSKTFPYILTSGTLADIVAESLGVDSIPASISAEAIPDTSIFTINVTASNAQTAYDVLQAVIKYYPQVAEYIIGDTQLTLMDESGVPEKPQNPQNFIGAISKGVAAGAALSLFLLLVYASTRRTVRREEDLKKYLSISYLGSVPRARGKRRKSKKTVLLDGNGNTIVLRESFRTIRTRVTKVAEEDDLKSFIVTSAASEEGKTTVAVNLAISIAKKGKKVVLLDCDLRHPSVAKAMGVTANEKGISDLLDRKADLKSVMIRYGEYELDVLPGKESVQDPTVLLGNGYLEKLLKVLRKNYDYVIVDTPPCGMLSDASVVARMTDGAVMVVRQDCARIDRILNGVENIADTGSDLIGYVLNSTEMGITGYGYGYGYGYGHYGHYGYYGKKE